MSGELAGKTAVVTGASRGIGRAIAMRYAREGAAVVVASRTTDERPAKLPGTNEETVRAIEAEGGRAIAVRCDLRSDEDIAALYEATMNAFGQCDILVNNAGISFKGNVLDMPLARWDQVMAVNVRGPLATALAFVPGMIERGGGTIINVSSGAATRVGAGRLNYSVSKAALDKLTAGMAAELEEQHVRCVSLGLEIPVVTDGFKYVNPGVDTSDWESPDIMGEAAVWIARHADAYTGQVVTIAQLRQDYAAGAPSLA